MSTHATTKHSEPPPPERAVLVIRMRTLSGARAAAASFQLHRSKLLLCEVKELRELWPLTRRATGHDSLSAARTPQLRLQLNATTAKGIVGVLCTLILLKL